jgi:hypothetical protein
VAKYYFARSKTIPPLPWQTFALPFSPDGATLNEITTATKWQAHTVRGAMSGALSKKLGLVITSEKDDVRGRLYRIAPGA